MGEQRERERQKRAKHVVSPNVWIGMRRRQRKRTFVEHGVPPRYGEEREDEIRLST
jgi:hypothetical protein